MTCRLFVTIAAVCSTVLLGACDQAEEVVNKGGNTPCSEFIAQDDNTQHITVRKYLEQDTKVTPAPNDDQVNASIAAITLMCRAQANPNTPIRDADLTGILVPKK
ncbi:hypothetical protein [Nocardia terpenica]|uniref:Acid stress chaperone HdeA n=1 Tax=Nocardia terpenica TaxID=455432 RepID=A0A164MH61_9NOCA|nr:hypothetical protein [Nocardia terpenica]KZM73356.1 hypothetical protein AWN90_32390 [Nocardia terpenica]NQE87488.1 hypothetical protein [Nocardia terpenica]